TPNGFAPKAGAATTVLPSAPTDRSSIASALKRRSAEVAHEAILLDVACPTHWRSAPGIARTLGRSPQRAPRRWEAARFQAPRPSVSGRGCRRALAAVRATAARMPRPRCAAARRASRGDRERRTLRAEDRTGGA